MSDYIKILMDHVADPTATPWDNDPTDAEIDAWYDEIEERLPHDYYADYGGDVMLDDFQGAEGKMSREELRKSLTHFVDIAAERVADDCSGFIDATVIVDKWIPKMVKDLTEDGWEFTD